MPRIPESVRETALSKWLAQCGLERIFQGKVRDTYSLPGYPNLLLVVTTDRISIFDFVLPALIPFKGEVLNSLTIFWLTQVFNAFPHHLVAYGAGIDQFLPVWMQGNLELHARAIVVERLEMISVEAIPRAYLTGSAWKEYREKGPNLWGHELPSNLHDGAKLPEPIFTPTTKSPDSHDLSIPIGEFRMRYSPLAIKLEELSLQIFNTAQDFMAQRGFLIADTKFEFGRRISDGKAEIVLADEVLTPDSSRYWKIDEWRAAQKLRKSPIGYDKQPVRDYFAADFKGREPTDKADLEFVANLKVPLGVISDTSTRYLELFRIVTGWGWKISRSSR